MLWGAIPEIRFQADDKKMNEQTERAAPVPGAFFEALPALPENAAVTMAYVPFQRDKQMYGDAEALASGTLFRALDKPFLRGCLK